MWYKDCDVSINVGAITRYSSPYLEYPVIVTDKGYDTSVYYAPMGEHIFQNDSEALHLVKNIFTKASILKKTENLLKQEENYTVISDYISGQAGVKLLAKEDDSLFMVTINNIPVIQTDNIDFALNKFYSEIVTVKNAQDMDKDISLEIFGEQTVLINRSALDRIGKLGQEEAQLTFRNMVKAFMKYEPPMSRFHEMPMPNQQEGDDSVSSQYGGFGRKDKQDIKYRPKKPMEQEPIDGGSDKKNAVPSSPEVLSTIKPAFNKEFDPMSGRIKPGEYEMPKEKDIVPTHLEDMEEKEKRKVLHPPEQQPIETGGTNNATPFVQKDFDIKQLEDGTFDSKEEAELFIKDFPKIAEGEQAHGIDEHQEGKTKIGKNDKPLDGGEKLKTLNAPINSNSAFKDWSLHKPTVITGKKQEPIEHSDKYMKSMSMRELMLTEKLKIDWSKVDINEFRMGMKEEMEHKDVTGGDPETTAKIALAHLEEDPKYYSKLKEAMKKAIMGREANPLTIGQDQNPAELTNQTERPPTKKEHAPVPNNEAIFEKSLRLTINRWADKLSSNDPIIMSLSDLRLNLLRWQTVSSDDDNIRNSLTPKVTEVMDKIKTIMFKNISPYTNILDVTKVKDEIDNVWNRL